MAYKDDECCGNCRWHEKEKFSNEWCCNNPDSVGFADYTAYNDCCKDWEGRETRKNTGKRSP